MAIVDLNTHASSYVTVAELAEYWDVTRQLVYKHIQSGQLPAVQLGPRCFRVQTKAAAEFERRLTTRPLRLSVAQPKIKAARAQLNLAPKR